MDQTLIRRSYPPVITRLLCVSKVIAAIAPSWPPSAGLAMYERCSESRSYTPARTRTTS